ncbi:rho GTPase-activating protein 5-like [Dorcoceras hygrometricum]|uniref:Rho GTPase-activating protein 5-like n=1 Tax=Dorcoceras hygrometricum TaxID=472368 RepID=A0A2Z7BAZ1_9LAMI|nr:rho GTPase-activating protein 5-like [Dorcoceras hygrometricum]
MTEVLHSPSSSSSPSITTPTRNATLYQTQSYIGDEVISGLAGNNNIEEDNRAAREKREKERRDQLSLLAILVTLFRKSFWVACKAERADFSGVSGSGGSGVMEIGWPTDVQHVNHVTFDRFNGFLGLPVEFEPEVSRRAPSASATVFGVSTESMQLSYDPRGNSIPTILLLMQRHLYSQGGLQAEGIFRITAGNSQEEFVRDQLNRGVIPEGVDVHCLAGLIKTSLHIRRCPAFESILDTFDSTDYCSSVLYFLSYVFVFLYFIFLKTLLDWAINLMADVVLQERLNKMNARNIAMVFAPNMTQMADPLTALMYAVQVMNFLKTLIEKTLREREDSVIEPAPTPDVEPLDDNGNQNTSLLGHENHATPNEEAVQVFLAEDPGLDSDSETNHVEGGVSDEDYLSYSTSTEESDDNVLCETPDQVYGVSSAKEAITINGLQNHIEENKMGNTGGQSSNSYLRKPESRIDSLQTVDLSIKTDDRNKGISNLSRINSVIERFEAWR